MHKHVFHHERFKGFGNILMCQGLISLSSSFLWFSGMDGRAEINLRQEEAGGADAGLRERAGHLQQQVRSV